MTRQHCLSEETLSAHLDGDLEAGAAAQVEAHLDACASCRAVLADLEALRGALAGLGDVEPAHDLWGAISVRHHEEANRRRARLRWLWPSLAMAAAAAFALVVLVPRGEPPASRIEVAYQSVVDAEGTYIESIAALEEAVAGDAVVTLTPEARAAIEQGLAQIDATIALCRRELDTAPHDFGAHRTLLAAYQRKVDLLTELVDQSI
jgi:anti-sigma factor RsiW